MKPARSARGAAGASRIDRAEAILLRVSPATESSCLASWLTARGRLVTRVKGCFRSKSPFLGHLDLFRTCELLYYVPRRPDAAAIAREAAVARPRDGLRSNWKAAAAASYLCDLAGRVFADPPSSRAGFERLQLALDALNDGRAPGSILVWFELHAAEALGWKPRLDSCAACGTPQPGNSEARFAPGMGGLVCPPCLRARRDDAYPLSARLRRLLAAWQSAPDPAALPEARLAREDADRIEQALGEFLRHHLELDLTPRQLAFHCLRRAKRIAEPP